MRDSNFEVSSIITTRFPRNNPSLLSMLMLRNVSFSSLLIMLVRLLTIPISWQVPRVVKPNKEKTSQIEMSVSGRGITRNETITEDIE